MVTIFPDFELLIGTKKIFRLLPVLAVALSLTACETYKVDDPDMTAPVLRLPLPIMSGV